jgi:hypothetical protein
MPLSKIIEQLQPLVISIEKVRLDPRNARSHPDTNLYVLKKSLESYGQRKPIVANKNTGFIEAGNGLYLAAKSLGWHEIAAILIDDNTETAAGYGLIDNQSGLLAGWNLANLNEIINELKSKDFDLSLTGFSDEELNEFLSPVLPEHTVSKQLSKGYVEGITEIDPLKLAYRLESVCHCPKRNLAIDMFSGKGRLSFWYQRLFTKVIRVDKELFEGIDFNQKAEKFLTDHLHEYMDFDFIDFDDEGCPGKELQLFFSLVEHKKSPFILCITDGLGLALKVRGKINLYEKYLCGTNEAIKITNDIPYREFDHYVTHLVNTLCESHSFYNRTINWYRGADGNVIYAGFEIIPK